MGPRYRDVSWRSQPCALRHSFTKLPILTLAYIVRFLTKMGYIAKHTCLVFVIQSVQLSVHHLIKTG
jgi:hypothetical protein